MVEAVLVVDMLNDFVTGKLKCERAQPIIPNIRRLNNAARKNDVEVIFVNDAHLPTDYELKVWGPHAMKGTPGARVIPELKPKKIDHVIEKRTYSGFYETGLDPLLRDLDVKNLYLTGLHTHMCARHTAADAFFRKYGLVAVEDGLQAFTEKDHQEGLAYFPNYNAKVKKTDEIIGEWGGRKNV